MALQQDHTFKGITLTGAYHAVAYHSGQKDRIHFDVRVYKDKATKDANKEDFVDSFSFVMGSGNIYLDDSANDKNFYKQAYEFMKAATFTDAHGVGRDYTSATDV